ncbi:hypothetical protein LSH36_161g06012 [Paralvinella palmiformis]|uniref:LamG-like jellyroll fold domain-containing protein n=1 Tax=Paralvinella palmiformis TaxID=53620 RepID=A0AAD9JTW2_9ANNE|nr:hypothetical protein LSH36_161g06012 [Paralvinella palmiformis]
MLEKSIQPAHGKEKKKRLSTGHCWIYNIHLDISAVSGVCRPWKLSAISNNIERSNKDGDSVESQNIKDDLHAIYSGVDLISVSDQGYYESWKCMWTSEQRYVTDSCSCGYYQCINDEFGGFKLQKMACPKCTCWDPSTMTCIRNAKSTGTGCDTKQIKEKYSTSGSTCTVTGPNYSVKFGSAYPDSKSYYMYVFGRKIRMPCPPGTKFILYYCHCMHAEDPKERDPFMRLTFDEKDPFANQQGLFVDAKDVTITDKGKVGKAAYFNGKSSNIEVPAFNNKETPVMSLSLWYMRDSTSDDGPEALLSNDACSSDDDPTIQVLSTGYSKILGGFRAGRDTDKISSTNSFSDKGVNNWNHIVVVYDGSKITLYLNGQVKSTREASGMIKPAHCPLLIGSMYGKNYFKGYMDEICFYNYALDANQVDHLYNVGRKMALLMRSSSRLVNPFWFCGGRIEHNVAICLLSFVKMLMGIWIICGK